MAVLQWYGGKWGRILLVKMIFWIRIFRSKNTVFVPFAVRDFDSKVLVFLFLNTVKWFRQEINAYHGGLLQNERRDLKHISNLQNEKSRFWSVFQVYKIKKSFLKHILNLQNETTRMFTKITKQHVFEAFFKFAEWKSCFLSDFQVYTMKKRFWSVSMFTKWKKKTFLKHVSSLQNEKTRFWSVFQIYKM